VGGLPGHKQKYSLVVVFNDETGVFCGGTFLFYDLRFTN